MTHSNSNLIQNSTGSRVIFLDNLRYLFVFGVVLQHACSAYIPSGWSYNMSWWPVTDSSHPFTAWVLALCDAFLMPSLFFIAGYFSIPSIKNRSISDFIKGKLKRLGIPWLICIFFICPILPFIYHYTRDGLKLSGGYWEIWLAVTKSAAEFTFGILPPMDQVMQNNLFYQRYMWFIGLLLAFFLIFSILYGLKKKWFDSATQPSNPVPATALSTAKVLFAVGIFTFIGSSILIFSTMILSDASNPESWITLGNFVQFRISRIFLHITYFTMGIFAYKRRWIQRGRFPGHPKAIIFFFITTLIAFFTFRELMINGSDSMQEVYMGGFWLCLNLFTISSLSFFMLVASAYWNQPTAINRNLSTNSYNIYLSHYPFVFLFQLILFAVPGISPLIKFTIVSTLAISFSYLTSQFLIRPYPRFTIAVIVALFFIMGIVTKT